ncbi:MAG TPA: Kdo hydroxylase family protein [Methylophilaceae bacterium]|nr:Kdo hydroxylase family protein [Methylophilaceae bacterium]
MESFQPLLSLDIQTWQPQIQPALSDDLAMALENGKVLCLPQLAFDLSEQEQAFLSPAWLSGKRKNISLEGEQVGGASGTADEMSAMAAMIKRYAEQATSLVTRLFPGYKSQLKPARTSFRPGLVQGNPSSWRKDDSRLHVDAFPSRPNHGERILRVFTNVNPHGIPRVWRVGEPFEAAARHFLPRIPRPMPGSAKLLQALQITKTNRSEYDHIMLHLHDKLKADIGYQKDAPQQEVQFQPGTTWICFSDQVLHAAMSGQFMFEQTFYLPVAAQYHPELSPLKVLESIKGRSLVA